MRNHFSMKKEKGKTMQRKSFLTFISISAYLITILSVVAYASNPYYAAVKEAEDQLTWYRRTGIVGCRKELHMGDVTSKCGNSSTARCDNCRELYKKIHGNTETNLQLRVDKARADAKKARFLR